MDTFKDKDCQECSVTVLLAHSTNFQHTSLLQCSLKLKLNQLKAKLKAYEPLYCSSLMGKAQLQKVISITPDQSLCSGDGITLRFKTSEPRLYLPGIKMTVIIRVSIVKPAQVESLPQQHTCPSTGKYNPPAVEQFFNAKDRCFHTMNKHGNRCSLGLNFKHWDNFQVVQFLHGLLLLLGSQCLCVI